MVWIISVSVVYTECVIDYYLGFSRLNTDGSVAWRSGPYIFAKHLLSEITNLSHGIYYISLLLFLYWIFIFAYFLRIKILRTVAFGTFGRYYNGWLDDRLFCVFIHISNISALQRRTMQWWLVVIEDIIYHSLFCQSSAKHFAVPAIIKITKMTVSVLLYFLALFICFMQSIIDPFPTEWNIFRRLIFFDFNGKVLVFF